MLMGDPRRRTEPWDSSAFPNRRDGRVVEGARLESVYRGNSIEGSNPSLSASLVRINSLPDLRKKFAGRFAIKQAPMSLRDIGSHEDAGPSTRAFDGAGCQASRHAYQPSKLASIPPVRRIPR